MPLAAPASTAPSSPPAILPRASVVIPCHNDGPHLLEAVDSVRTQTFGAWEIVIVDDGSTDAATHQALDACQAARLRVIREEHRGLPTARNTGIAAACGEYILPLDADDRMAPTYLEQAVAVLDRRPEVGIVYCQAEFFGAQSGPWQLPPFSLQEMLLHNVVFASAMFRKADWQAVGGYKPSMKYGWEDWEFWLSLLELGRQAYCLPRPLFFYRRKADSMIASLARRPDEQDYSFREILRHHRRLYAAHARWLWRNRWIFAGREHLVFGLLPAVVARTKTPGSSGRSAAAILALAAWAAAQCLCRPGRRTHRPANPLPNAHGSSA